MKIEVVKINWRKPEAKRLHDIPGNEAAKRAVEVALTGSHEMVILSTIRSPASDLLRVAAKIAKDSNIPFNGTIIPVCPCGCYGHATEECNCTSKELERYILNIMQAIRDASIIIEAYEPKPAETCKGNEPESTLVSRVLETRKLSSRYDVLDSDSEELLRHAIREIHVSRDRVIAVASTIALMDRRNRIEVQHVSEAVQYQHRYISRRFDGYEVIKERCNNARDCVLKAVDAMQALRGGISIQNAAGQIVAEAQKYYDEINKRVNRPE